MLKKNRNVLYPLAKRGDLQRERIQSIVEIFPKLFRSYRTSNINVRSCQHTDIDTNRLRASQPAVLAVLQYLQQLRLWFRRHFGDLIQKNCAFIAGLELSRRGFRRAGKRSSLIAKQFAFKQFRRKGGAVNF